MRNRIKDNAEVFKKFMFGIKPLAKEGRLGCVLVQFPYYFYPSMTNFKYILRCKEYLSGVSTVIEFRNRDWVAEETFNFLRKNDLGFCIVDEPRLPRLMPMIFTSTSSIAYFRLHGRNPHWFRSSKEERYNYSYTDHELQEFVSDIRQLERDAQRLYIFFNNCYGGYAAKNAR